MPNFLVKILPPYKPTMSLWEALSRQDSRDSFSLAYNSPSANFPNTWFLCANKDSKAKGSGDKGDDIVFWVLRVKSTWQFPVEFSGS